MSQDAPAERILLQAEYFSCSEWFMSGMKAGGFISELLWEAEKDFFELWDSIPGKNETN